VPQLIGLVRRCREAEAARERELANEKVRLAEMQAAKATDDIIADWASKLRASADVQTVRGKRIH
jgi:hypothetical protein